MLRVIEAFSGIGSQAKALSRRNIEHQILATCDWDISAIIAYDLIHNGNQIIDGWEHISDDDLNRVIEQLNISGDSKTPMKNNAKRRLNRETKIRLLSSVFRTKNYLDITCMNGAELPCDANVFTYSFPCQDLSLAGSWQGNEGGIDRGANNRSSLLWEVERILMERVDSQLTLPKFLLMENVSNILSKKHINNFNEWKDTLNELGYQNLVLTLNANRFGVPQSRARTFMISVNCINDRELEFIQRIFDEIDENTFHERYPREQFALIDALKLDYNNLAYLNEGMISNPNLTPSRIEIFETSLVLGENIDFVPTITTKQDRFPNSGVIPFPNRRRGKANFRYLTPRECFILMGFDERDYNAIEANNFLSRRNCNFFSRDRLNRLAGNSICVNVLESIFEFIDFLNDEMIQM